MVKKKGAKSKKGDKLENIVDKAVQIATSNVPVAPRNEVPEIRKSKRLESKKKDSDTIIHQLRKKKEVSASTSVDAAGPVSKKQKKELPASTPVGDGPVSKKGDSKLSKKNASDGPEEAVAKKNSLKEKGKDDPSTVHDTGSRVYVRIEGGREKKKRMIVSLKRHELCTGCDDDDDFVAVGKEAMCKMHREEVLQKEAAKMNVEKAAGSKGKRKAAQEQQSVPPIQQPPPVISPCKGEAAQEQSVEEERVPIDQQPLQVIPPGDKPVIVVRGKKMDVSEHLAGKFAVKEIKQVATFEYDGKTITKGFIPGWKHVKVVKLCSKLSEKQKSDVEAIGFGGLLMMKLQKPIPPGIMPWLVSHFNPILSQQSVGPADYSISADDIFDVFCLPRHPGNPVEKKRNDDLELRRRYKAAFDCQDKKDIPLKKVYSRIMELVDGGDEFKRLFVLYCSSYLLAPIAGSNVDFKILGALENVAEIKNLDRCSFVLEDLLGFINRYQEQEKYSTCSACVPILLFEYLHRVPIRGELEPLSLPFLQHWDDEKLAKRVRLLEKAGFGSSILVNQGFPVCNGGKYRFAAQGPSVQPLLPPMQVSPLRESRGAEDGELRLPIPSDIETDANIRSVAENEFDENIMIIRRNFNVVTADMLKRMKRFKPTVHQAQVSTHPLEHDGATSTQPQSSQLEQQPSSSKPASDQQHSQPQSDQPLSQPPSQPLSQPLSDQALSQPQSSQEFWSSDLLYSVVDKSVRKYLKEHEPHLFAFDLLGSQDEWGQ